MQPFQLHFYYTAILPTVLQTFCNAHPRMKCLVGRKGSSDFLTKWAPSVISTAFGSRAGAAAVWREGMLCLTWMAETAIIIKIIIIGNY